MLHSLESSFQSLGECLACRWQNQFFDYSPDLVRADPVVLPFVSIAFLHPPRQRSSLGDMYHSISNLLAYKGRRNVEKVRQLRSTPFLR